MQEAARILCLTEGHDPDELIERNGLPSIPRWILAQRELRKEQKASLLSTPQPEAYRNAPLTVIGNHEAKTIEQMRSCMSHGNVVAEALCADGHLGYAQPVGGVIAYERQISISGVGFDIACGNMAVRLNTTVDEIRERLPAILSEINQVISFGLGRKNEERVNADLFDDTEAWRTSAMGRLKDKARAQLGTVGSGNHYVDVFSEVPATDDECSQIWIGVHFGSRGLGHATATHYLKAAGGRDGMNVPPAIVDEDSEIGARYIAGMELAGRYAYAGREWVVDRVRRIIGGEVTKTVHDHHNFAWRETHFGKECWVVRKGATPAFEGQEGFIDGSMGDHAVIVESGKPSAATQNLLSSTVHGAGRVLGRRDALRSLSRGEMIDWLRRENVLLAGGDLDESPMTYRRLKQVLSEQGNTITINHVLKPLLVVMAGNDTVDPYKN
ncbi:RtcB family protein [Asaia spathodeae]|uniref:RtcB family protein n=1 Tax=Asaia spathodeae TaxID=657016 RepID=UPI002FC34638